MVKIAYKYTKADKTVIKDTQVIGNMEIVKHFVVAGCGQVLSKKHLKKAKAALTYFEDFFPNNINTRGFIFPSGYLYDPTAKAQFSNLIGKALADYFFKKFFKNGITMNYEAMMKIKYGKVDSVSRPDLYGVSNFTVFSIEAKGYTRTTSKKDEHKKQAKSGPLFKNYAIASVTEKIYSNIHVDFYDPPQDGIELPCTEEEYTKAYYKNIVEDFYKTRELRSIKKYGEDFIILEIFKFKGEFIALAILESVFDRVTEGKLPNKERKIKNTKDIANLDKKKETELREKYDDIINKVFGQNKKRGEKKFIITSNSTSNYMKKRIFLASKDENLYKRKTKSERVVYVNHYQNKTLNNINNEIIEGEEKEQEYYLDYDGIATFKLNTNDNYKVIGKKKYFINSKKTTGEKIKYFIRHSSL